MRQMRPDAMRHDGDGAPSTIAGLAQILTDRLDAIKCIVRG